MSQTISLQDRGDSRGTELDDIGDSTEQVVLIVEDDPQVAELYSDWLTDDYSVRIAHSVAEAYSLSQGHVDAVMLDRRLGTTPVADVVGPLRESEGKPSVALLTAVEPDVDIIDLDIHEYITKPIKKHEFRACVTRLLGRRSLSRKLDARFALASKLAALEASRGPASPETTEDYSRLRTAFEHLSEDVATEVRGLTPREYRNVIRDVNS